MLAVFVQEVGDAYFEEDVVVFEILLELFFVFDDGVFEGDTVGADEVGIDDKVVFAFGITGGHGLIPDFFVVVGFDVHAGNNGRKEHHDDCHDADDSKCFVHFPPFFG